MKLLTAACREKNYKVVKAYLALTRKDYEYIPGLTTSNEGRILRVVCEESAGDDRLLELLFAEVSAFTAVGVLVSLNRPGWREQFSRVDIDRARLRRGLETARRTDILVVAAEISARLGTNITT